MKIFLSILFAFLLITLILLAFTFLPARSKKKVVTKVTDISAQLKKIFKSITADTLSQKREEIIELLEVYKKSKCEEYAAILVPIKTSLSDFMNSLWNLEHSTIPEVDKNIEKAACDKNATAGASYLYQKELLERSRQTLKDSIKNLESKKQSIERELSMFSAVFAAKKTEILAMLSDTLVVKHIGDVDLRLNSLLDDFNKKVIEEETKAEVSSKILGASPITDSAEKYDEEAYLKKFQDAYLNKQ